MGAFFVYILKSAICLIAFYLFFRLLLNKETFHRFNRIALLAILLLSMLIPLCNITISADEQTEIHQTILYWEQIVVSDTLTENSEPIPWIQIILLIYVTGIVFFMGRNIYSLIRMLLLLKSSNCKDLNNRVKLITHKLSIAPFSWMRYIVISETDLEENGKEIILHELAHITNRHSIDLLLADICVFFQWFNPAAWLMRQELQNIHEYEADETVINNGINAKQYQLLLIKKAVGKRLYSMANSFNHSKLKKRITMMSKQKSKPWARLKYLYILPVAVITVSAFARTEVSNQLDEIANVKVNDLTEFVKTKVEENLPGAEFSDKENEVVYVENDDNSSPNEDKEKTIQIVEEKNPSSNTIRVKMSQDADSIRKNHNPVVIVDGKEINYIELKTLNINTIKSIDVIKDDSAIRLYGKKGENGIINITLKTEEEINATKSNKPISDSENPKSLQTQIRFIDKSNLSAADSVVYIYKNGSKKNRIYIHGLKTDSLKGNVKRINLKKVHLSELSNDSTKTVFVSISPGKTNKDSVVVVTGKRLNKSQD